MLVGCAAVLRAAQRSVTSVSTAVPISILFGCRNSWAKEWKTQAGDHRGGTRRARAHAPYWSPTGRHGGAPIPYPYRREPCRGMLAARRRVDKSQSFSLVRVATFNASCVLQEQVPASPPVPYPAEVGTTSRHHHIPLLAGRPADKAYARARAKNPECRPHVFQILE